MWQAIGSSSTDLHDVMAMECSISSIDTVTREVALKKKDSDGIDATLHGH